MGFGVRAGLGFRGLGFIRLRVYRVQGLGYIGFIRLVGLRGFTGLLFNMSRVGFRGWV